ncbi:MAG: molybdenum cofactor sulfurase [Pseudomonadota bacterium]
MPVARVVALHKFSKMQPDRPASASLSFDVDGIVGDRHRGHLRPNGRNDKQARGSMRRNERMWSAISTDELAQIAEDMGLAKPLTAADITMNIVLDGVPRLSRLPKGSLLRFPSGLELLVEEFCAPCLSKGSELAERYRDKDGLPLQPTAFSRAAKLSRGLLGIVDVAGVAQVGDEVEIVVYGHPDWLAPD